MGDNWAPKEPLIICNQKNHEIKKTTNAKS